MSGEKIIATNRKARHDYSILETCEAGMVLQGAEVKSLRQGQANLKDSFARIDEAGEMFLHNLYIKPYQFETVAEQNPTRIRKLLPISVFYSLDQPTPGVVECFPLSTELIHCPALLTSVLDLPTSGPDLPTSGFDLPTFRPDLPTSCLV